VLYSFSSKIAAKVLVERQMNKEVRRPESGDHAAKIVKSLQFSDKFS
jgi:hypothetical protein